MQKLSKLVNQLSFSRKLALTFFLCSLLTFLVIDVIMHILYSTVVAKGNSDSTFDTSAFSQFSNDEILSSAQADLESGLDLYEQIVTQIYSTHLHFSQNTNLFESKLEKGINPPLCQTFSEPQYDRTCVLFYSDIQTSSFYDEPYISKVMSASASKLYPIGLKRINVIYQNKQNLEDIMAVTLPATKDFNISEYNLITERVNVSYQGILFFTDWYEDRFSISNNKTQLISLRLLLDQGNYNMIIEIEVYKAILDAALSKVYSFPNTRIFLIKLREQGYTVMGQNENFFDGVAIEDFFEVGSQNVTIEGDNFLVTTKKISQIGEILVNATDPPVTNLRMIIFLNTSETMQPNIVYDEFRNNQYDVLVLLLYGWTFIVMLLVFSIGVVIGDIIFSYFKLIGEKCKMYRTNPQSINNLSSDSRYNSQGSRTQNKLLIEDIDSIMQGIEKKKAENRKNYKINYDNYPLNPMGIGFQSRMCLKDYDKLEEIAILIKEKLESH